MMRDLDVWCTRMSACSNAAECQERVGTRKSRFPSRTHLLSALGESPALAARQRLLMIIEIVVNKAGASMSARFGDLHAARLPRGA